MSGVKTGPYYTEPGRRRKVGALQTWAEDGLIFCEWQKDSTAGTKDAGDIEVLDVPSATNWLKMMHGDLEIWDRAREGAPTPKDRAYAIEYFHTLKSQMDAIRETIRDATDQGDQSNDEIRLKKLGAFLRARRGALSNTDGLPSVSGLLYPQGYERPRVFTTGKAMLFDMPPMPPLIGK